MVCVLVASSDPNPRNVAFEDQPSREALQELDAASEAFADRVPWEDEPEDKT